MLPINLVERVLKIHPVVDAWDLVVCAEWIENDIACAIEFIAKQLYKTFSMAGRRIMRIATVASDNPELLGLLDQYEADHAVKKIRRSNYFQRDIEQGDVLTARRRQQTEPG